MKLFDKHRSRRVLLFGRKFCISHKIGFSVLETTVKQQTITMTDGHMYSELCAIKYIYKFQWAIVVVSVHSLLFVAFGNGLVASTLCCNWTIIQIETEHEHFLFCFTNNHFEQFLLSTLTLCKCNKNRKRKRK